MLSLNSSVFSSSASLLTSSSTSSFIFKKEVQQDFSIFKKKNFELNSDDIDIYYFSGTGNTLKATQEMEKTFIENNKNVNLFKIEQTDPKSINKSHVIGLSFPVAFQSSYLFIWDFIKNLPNLNDNNNNINNINNNNNDINNNNNDNNNNNNKSTEKKKTQIFLMDTLGGYSGGILGPIKRILKSKGYEPIAGKEFIMPCNVFFIYPDFLNKMIVNFQIPRVKKYTQSIIDGKSKWNECKSMKTFSDFTAKIVQKPKYFNFDKLVIDNEKCIKCKLCIKKCPVGAIKIFKNDKNGEEYLKEFEQKCQVCMKCNAICPTNAISFPKLLFQDKQYHCPDVKINKL